jgi:hypothetical protein
MESVEMVIASGVAHSARCFAGGDAAARRPYLWRRVLKYYLTVFKIVRLCEC